MTIKAFVLMSGGIDSTTCFHLALRDHGAAIGISIDYGQRHSQEIDHAAATCEAHGQPHHILDLTGIIPRTMLTDPDHEIPSISYSEIKGVSPTYVPFRNGLMLAAVTSFIQGFIDNYGDEALLYFGAHAEDAAGWAYPDCTPEFTGAMANAIYVGTYHKTRLLVPLQYLDKAAIIRLGTDLGVDWTETWSCYKGGQIHCGSCPTCRARHAGFMAAGIADPTIYELVA